MLVEFFLPIDARLASLNINNLCVYIFSGLIGMANKVLEFDLLVSMFGKNYDTVCCVLSGGISASIVVTLSSIT